MKHEQVSVLVCVCVCVCAAVVICVYVMNLLFWASKCAKRTSKKWRVSFGNICSLMVYL